MAHEKDRVKKCPFCDRDIEEDAATKCPHCGAVTVDPWGFAIPPARKAPGKDRGLRYFLGCVVAALLPGILGVLLFYSYRVPPSTPPGTPEPIGPTVSICEAARMEIGSRVRIVGEFTYLDYGSKRYASFGDFDSPQCNGRGAGSLQAFLRRSESGKLDQAQPRGKRTPRKGARVVVEGVVEKVEDGRFVTLSDAVVVAQ